MKEGMNMFNNPRYMTIGIKNTIPMDLQIFLWSCIDNLREQEITLDYLQVFELKKVICDDMEYQLVEHRQEVPKYNKEYRIFPSENVDAKVFVLDDGDHSTMLLAEEY